MTPLLQDPVFLFAMFCFAVAIALAAFWGRE